MVHRSHQTRRRLPKPTPTVLASCRANLYAGNRVTELPFLPVTFFCFWEAPRTVHVHQGASEVRSTTTVEHPTNISPKPQLNYAFHLHLRHLRFFLAFKRYRKVIDSGHSESEAQSGLGSALLLGGRSLHTWLLRTPRVCSLT